MKKCVKNRTLAVKRSVFGCFDGVPAEGVSNRKITTSGFVAFSWYVRVTMAVVVVAMLPVILFQLFSMPLLGPAEFSWAKVVSRRRFKEGERVRRGLYHRLVGPSVKQMFAYIHVFVSNMAFFTLVVAAGLKIAEPSMDSVFKHAALSAIIPASVLFVIGVAYNYISRLFQFKDSLPLKYNARLLWRSPEKTYDRVEDSVLNLMFRDQVRDAMSMTSLARLDKQLLLGVPTAIVAGICYIYDLCTGQEQEASEIRENAKKHMGGLSVEFSNKTGLFRA
ncbi:MAG: hypothetical protein AB8U44_02340 [Aaplasma endosymbiont of Hyalomma asiaticum]